jgi:hypothetical protein
MISFCNVIPTQQVRNNDVSDYLFRKGSGSTKQGTL